MSRLFVKSDTASFVRFGNQANGLGHLLAGASKIAIAVWVYPTTVSTGGSDNSILHSVISGNGNTFGVKININGASGQRRVQVQVRANAADSAHAALSSGSVTLNAWNHIVTVIDLVAGSIVVYLNGTATTTSGITFPSATYDFPSGVNGVDWLSGSSTSSGAATPVSGTSQFEGRIAELAIWTFASGETAHDSTDVSTLYNAGSGLNANVLKRSNMRYYLPLYGNLSPETALVDTRSGAAQPTVGASSVQAAHPFSAYRVDMTPIASTFSVPNDFQISEGGGGVPVPPTVFDVAVNSAGTQITFTFDEATTGNAGFSLTDADGSVYTLSSPTSGGGGTTRAYTLYPKVMQGKVLTWTYTPGDVADLGDAAMEAATGAVTNGSTFAPTIAWDKAEGGWASVRILTAVQHSGSGASVLALEARPVDTDFADKSILVKRRLANGSYTAEQNLAPFGSSPKAGGAKYNPSLTHIRTGTRAGRLLLFFTAYDVGVNSGNSDQNEYSVYLSYSDDGGVTWSVPADVSTAIGVNRSTHYTYHASPGRGIQIATGTYAGRIVIPVQIKVGANSASAYRQFLLYSDDVQTVSDPTTATWHLSNGSDLGGDHEGGVAEDGDGSLLLAYRNSASASNGSARRMARSTNGGQTIGAGYWESEVTCPTVQTSLLGDPTNDIILHCGPNNPSSRTNGSVWWTQNPGTDGSGDEWSNAVLVGGAGQSFEYSAMVNRGSGNITAFYEDSGAKGIRAADFDYNTLGIVVPLPPTITQHPSPQSKVEGQNASFSAAAVGTPSPTGQWQVSTDAGESYSNIVGATDTTYTFTTALSDNGKLYRYAATNTAGTTYSNPAGLTVTSAGETTPPVIASAATNTGGTHIDVDYTEVGSQPVLPQSGAVTGYGPLSLTRAGSPVSINVTAGVAVSATRHRLFLAGAVLQGDSGLSLTYTAASGNVSDSATPPNLMANATPSVTNNSTVSGGGGGATGATRGRFVNAGA
jgi:hypothetical protein